MNSLEERHLQFAFFLSAVMTVATIFWLKFDPSNKALLASLGSVGVMVGAAVAMLLKIREKQKRDLRKHSLTEDINNLDLACQKLTDGKAAGHPLPVMLGGYFTELSKEIVKDSVELSPDYYQACFSNLAKHGSAEIRAIADLSDDGENWSKSQTTLWEGVRERIFHIHWKDLYSGRLEVFLERSLKLDKQKIKENRCEVKLISSREADKLSWGSIFHSHESIGKNLLIIGDSLIGGYVASIQGKGVQLRLEVPSSAEVTRNETLYERMASHSIDMDASMSARDIRVKWIEKFEIGLWDPSWNNKQERGVRYVDDYDQHIYCWVPDYDAMIAECFEEIRDELDQRCRSNKRKIEILELGCGTGILTEPIVGWILGLQNIFSERFSTCRAIDQSKKMLERAQERISSAHNTKCEQFIDFSQIRFDATSPNESGVKYDIIFGSLIFHFLIGEEWSEETINRVISHIKSEWLAEDGCMIWADLFFSECDREAQTEYWFDHMAQMGMSESSIKVFRENNRDMTDAPSYEVLKAALSNEGCVLRLKTPAINRNPFNIVKISNCSPTSASSGHAKNARC